MGLQCRARVMVRVWLVHAREVVGGHVYFFSP